jgi:hypothetical protein
MLQVRAYYSAAIRGPAGNDATDEQIQKNLHKACIQAKMLQNLFGECLYIYCPHQHDQLIQLLWRAGQVTDSAILQADLQIQNTCDMTIVNDTIKSGGVELEIQNALNKKEFHPIIFIQDELSNDDIVNISFWVNRMLTRKYEDESRTVKNYSGTDSQTAS